MSRRWRLAALGCAVLIATIIYMRVGKQDLLFPALEHQLDTVQSLEIASPGGTVLLNRKTSGEWEITSAAKVKAKKADVRLFLLALGKAARLDSKSADPARWPEMGLGPLETRIILQDTKLMQLADLRIGKPVPGMQSPVSGNKSYFARLASGGSAFTLSQIPVLPKDAAGWADITLPSIARRDITEFSLTSTDLTQAKLVQSAPDKLELFGKRANEELNEARCRDVLESLRGIEPLELAEAGRINWYNAHTFFVKTKTGLIISGQMVMQNNKAWLRLNGSSAPGAKFAVQHAAENINSIRALAIRIELEKAKLLMSRRSDFILPAA